jgi:Putative DNA-binding domain
MLPVQFEDIRPDDILKLVEDKISERRTLEYKEKLSIGNTDEKAEFLSDISSFANASGGDIIFGVSDERDQRGNATGIPSKVVDLKIANPASECGRIEQLIESGIQPRIPVVHVQSFDIPENGTVILVRVGKSWIAPHMVSYANRSRFFSRNSTTGKVQLDVQQIGAAFALQRGMGERLRGWRADRIAKAISGDGPVPLRGAQILFHFVSAADLSEDQISFPRVFEPREWGAHYRLMSLSPQTLRYNADGFLIYSRPLSEDRGSYLQIFRDGSLEYCDAYALQNGDQRIASKLFEQKLVQTFSGAMGILSLLGATEPIFVTLTLIDVKDRVMALPSSATSYSLVSESFDREVISSPDVRVQNFSETPPFTSTLQPIVDSIWQAAGMKHSPYRQDGVWNPDWRQLDPFDP